jgi:hypothetical protein
MTNEARKLQDAIERTLDLFVKAGLAKSVTMDRRYGTPTTPAATYISVEHVKLEDFTMALAMDLAGNPIPILDVVAQSEVCRG